MKTRNFYLKIYTLPLAKTCGTNHQKPKGGPLEEKNILFKKYFRNKNMFKIAFWPMQPSARSLHAVHNRCKACTECAEGWMGQNTVLNMFLFLKYFFWIFKPILVHIWELFWKKYFFLPRLYFWHGSNLKIEISSFSFFI